MNDKVVGAGDDALVVTHHVRQRLCAASHRWTCNRNELEASFSGKTVGETTTFLAVAQRLEAKGFRAMPQEDYMNIITPDQVRFTLTGMGAIEAYCREESLEGIPFTAMIKDRAGVESNVDLKEYDVRVKIRREITLSETDPVVLQILGRWPQQRKAFRIMRRWTFMDEANGVRFDQGCKREFHLADDVP